MKNFLKKLTIGSSANSTVNTDSQKIDSFLKRGIENVFPSKEYLKKQLGSGKRQTLYLGIDPTAPTLHLGHAVTLFKLKELQDMGHQIILLIGDFTATIGDPTGKSETRRQLTHKQVLENATQYKKQASKFLNFSGPNKALLKYNSAWLGKMNFADVISLSAQMTVDQMLKRDMFDQRIKEEKPIYIHEFLYPLMQGYDSVAMNVDGEIGGNDQTFNMLAGRHLMEKLQNKEKFVITVKLLTDSSGKKMGKTEGNMVSLDMSANEMFGRIMSWSDGLILPALELCTNMESSKIEKIKADLESGKNPKDAKTILAKEVVSWYHSKEASDKAQADFEATFSGGKISKSENGEVIIPSSAIEISVPTQSQLSGVLVENGVVASKAEFKRLVEEGAVSNIETGEKISDYYFTLTSPINLKIGKKRFVKIVIKG